ncbi:multidrug ABC transporter ATP-binding protein [Paenibacillus chitinolyticus]|uniref:ATP-binding cassette domain-containing protein n=1 Tax=Paenibacillus chitinolyticus TaxID=79263 RepID=UPI0026E4BB66|nr:ABC transporter ATP-binding protein [Paenibacillus chitinolyticus]GKS11109.1 multidrug ABC transporter ATP-binding protein [Paenibacillus chitinolyticus]
MEKATIHIKKAGYGDSGAILRDIDFRILEGQLIGLIGPNGAGKSTTIKSMLGLLKDVEGNIEFADGRASVAYVPEQPVLYEELTLWEHMELAAAAYGLERPVFEERAEALLAQFKLSADRHRLPVAFSKGMQQKERERGAGILMSTHVLDTAERICDSFLLLSEGRIVAQGTLDEVRQESGLPDGTLFDCFHALV